MLCDFVCVEETEASSESERFVGADVDDLAAAIGVGLAVAVVGDS